MSQRWVRLVGGFLALSYGIGAPTAAFFEYRAQSLSDRFHIAPELIFLACGAQLVPVGALLTRRFAPWAAGVLTLTSLGAVGAHLRIGSPLTALPAIVFSLIQAWFGLRASARSRARI